MDFDSDRCWQAIEAGDARLDGWVFCGVTSTGIYCRPSCPARTPKRENVRFFSTAAAAQGAGFRACKRCGPDATPGSPEWDARADLVGRAMRLIADGVVDRDGVAGLARALGYTERHVHRRLVEVLGVGPLALARAQRAQTARILLETTDVAIGSVAFAAGFSSVRQFNDTIREVFAMTPGEVRRRVGSRRTAREPGAIVLRLPYREPLDAGGLLGFLAARAVAGVEDVEGDTYRRSLRLPHAAGIIELRPAEGFIQARLWLADLRDLAAAVQRSRAVLDLDADPQAVSEALGRDRVIGRLVRATPGRRVPGAADGFELATRAVIGQQVSVAGAATVAAQLVQACGEALAQPLGAITHLFPSPAQLLAADPSVVRAPHARRAAVRALSRAAADGELVLDAGADREDTRRRLLELPGIGPWTADYVAMRALRDPDAFLASDLGVRHAIEQLGQAVDATSVTRLSERWRPYRSYAVQHLWKHLEAARRAPLAARPAPARTRTRARVRVAA